MIAVSLFNSLDSTKRHDLYRSENLIALSNASAYFPEESFLVVTPLVSIKGMIFIVNPNPTSLSF